MLQNNELGIRAAATYLLYALYFKQPLAHKVRIRISKDEYQDLNEFFNQCRSDAHWDLVFVWTKLLVDHAFIYSGKYVCQELETSY